MLQLTWRAVLMGSVLGGVLSLTNLYIGLKAGWGFGVAITACILVGVLVGILIPLLGLLLPKYEKWMPPAAGLGFAWTFEWKTSLLFFLGAIIGYALERRRPQAVRGVSLSGGLRRCRRRLADGRVADFRGKRPANAPPTLWRLTAAGRASL